MPAIELNEVRKSFGRIQAVDGLNLEVPEGICLGLLGPNGAGKSTTMRLLTGQSIADSGSIKVLGLELPRQSKPARARMGVVPQLDNLDVDVTVEQNLAVFARLYRAPDVPAAVDRALDIARLRDRRKDAVAELSGGMRRRLLLARGLVHDPELVLLDEPTVGLDPQIRTQLWTLIDDLRTAGSTILMARQSSGEAGRVADDGGVMTAGKGIEQGKPRDLTRAHAGERTVEIYGPPHELDSHREKFGMAGVSVRAAGPAIAVLAAEQAPRELIPDHAVDRAASLEDVFVKLTGEDAE